MCSFGHISYAQAKLSQAVKKHVNSFCLLFFLPFCPCGFMNVFVITLLRYNLCARKKCTPLNDTVG